MKAPVSSNADPALQRVSVAALLVAITSAPVCAQEVPRGELAAAIRSAGHPCAMVHEVTSAGERAWRVRCNSGTFAVSADGAGGYAVDPE